MRWLASAWRGDFAASVVVCARGRRPTSRLSRRRGTCSSPSPCSTTSAHRRRAPTTYGLVPLALEVAARTDVALTRVSCLLGVAWAARRPRSRPVGRPRAAALDHIADVPALTRLTLPGSAPRGCCRGSTRRSPREALLEQLAATPTPALLRRHDPPVLRCRTARASRPSPTPPRAFGTVAAHRPAGAGSMMDFVDQARRASASADAVSLRALEATVRRGLAEVARLDVALALEPAGA